MPSPSPLSSKSVSIVFEGLLNRRFAILLPIEFLGVLVVTEVTTNTPFFGNLMAFVCPSPFYNSKKQVSAFLGN